MSAGLDALPADAVRAVLPELEDLQHDLGKYACFEVRFVGREAPTEELRAALRADLLATRRGASGTEAAWQVWARLRPPALGADPDVVAIDAAIAALREADLAGDRAALLAAADHAEQVRLCTRRLVQRARARLDEPDL